MVSEQAIDVSELRLRWMVSIWYTSRIALWLDTRDLEAGLDLGSSEDDLRVHHDGWKSSKAPLQLW